MPKAQSSNKTTSSAKMPPAGYGPQPALYGQVGRAPISSKTSIISRMTLTLMHSLLVVALVTAAIVHGIRR
jgi:hypothetical protein